MGKENRVRLILFIIVAAIHGVLIFFLAFNIQIQPEAAEEPVRVMKLTDIIEDIPLPPPPPPPIQETVPDNAVEAIAENMIETDEVPPDQVVVAAGTIQTPQNSSSGAAAETYLPMHQVSVGPKFDDSAISKNMIYPPIARRSGIEGTVYLELFIDRSGTVQQVRILKEDPPDRGFGEAAKKAFEGARCTPAQANGENVSVRYRYPVSFRIR